jgi:ribonuclease D
MSRQSLKACLCSHDFAYSPIVLDDPLIIIDQNTLSQWISRCLQAAVVALDTESASLFRYREKICLLQMSIPGPDGQVHDAIIDPLVIEDLSPLAEVLENPNIVKILHDAGYDLLGLERDYNFAVHNIFDTMLASRLLGERSFGLAALLLKYFDFKSNKKLQRSNWSRRPLSAAQIDYARYDTHFLPALRQKLIEHLSLKERIHWATEEFQKLPILWRQLSLQQRNKLPLRDAFWAFSSFHELSSLEKARFAALWRWRDTYAFRRDCPTFWIVQDKQMLHWVKKYSETGKLSWPGLSARDVQRHEKLLIRIFTHPPALPASPPSDLIQQSKRVQRIRFSDAADRRLYELLRQERSRLSAELNLEPEVLLSNAVLAKLVTLRPKTWQSLQNMQDLQGWRSEHVLDTLWSLLR